MGKNKVFFPQQLLDAWVLSQAVELHDQDLLLQHNQKQFRYHLTEGALITREVSGKLDIHDVVGRCKTLTFLQELGADILEQSMIIGDNAYEIVPGFLGAPMAHGSELESGNAKETTRSDEELLAMFLEKKL